MDISELKTPDAELFLPEIHIINKKIAIRRILWNRYLTIILDLFVKDIQENTLQETFIDRTDAFILSYNYTLSLTHQHSQFKIVKDYPKIYVIGGSSYNAYDAFINIKDNTSINNTSINIESVAPATHDYDILIALTQLNEKNYIIILTYLIEKLKKYIRVLSLGAYLEGVFKPFNQTDINKIEKDMGSNRHHECFIEYEDESQQNKKSYLEVNIQKSTLRPDLQYDYINIRCSVKIKEAIIENGEKKSFERIFDIFEFNLTNNSFIEIPIKCIIVLNSQNRITYRVPDAHSLCKLGIYSLIRRGLDKRYIIKCRQDYKRVNYFIKRMNQLYLNNKDLALKLYYLLPEYNYLQILYSIIQKSSLLNHCTTKIFVRDDFLKKSREELLLNEKTLLDIFIQSFIKDKSPLNTQFKIKYMKYKQKYLELQKML